MSEGQSYTQPKKKRMSTASCKAKGRRLQQEVAAVLLQIGSPYGLEEGDIQSIGMGQNGVDIVLSPAAKRLMNLQIECKNVENLNVVGIFLAHFEKYMKDDGLKLLIHARNRSRKVERDAMPLVTLRFSDLAGMFAKLIEHEQQHEQQQQNRPIGFGRKK